MTKKRLSDLLREELENPPGKVTTSISSESDAEGAHLASSSAKTSKSSSRTRSHQRKTTQARSEDKVKELTADLESANRRANSLEEQVASLQSQLETQRNLIETLQSKLEQITQTETELEENKKLVEKLYSELQKAESVQLELEEQKQLVRELSAQLQQAQHEQDFEVASDSSHSTELQLATIPNYGLQRRPIGRFIASSQPPTILSNEDIGWFD
jgi:predicted RNase H-like nuclease (RuvC/YqgF family)